MHWNRSTSTPRWQLPTIESDRVRYAGILSQNRGWQNRQEKQNCHPYENPFFHFTPRFENRLSFIGCDVRSSFLDARFFSSVSSVGNLLASIYDFQFTKWLDNLTTSELRHRQTNLEIPSNYGIFCGSHMRFPTHLWKDLGGFPL